MRYTNRNSMTLNYENETGAVLDLQGETEEALARRVIGAGLEIVDCPYDTQVSLLITDDEGIREMNRQFRGIDSPTDVLSFPLQEFPAPGDFSQINEEGSDEFDPDSGELLLGDIVINADRVISQAEEYGHSRKREYAFLIAHSILHLTGYDHMDEEEREQMEEMQRRIMKAVQIPR